MLRFSAPLAVIINGMMGFSAPAMAQQTPVYQIDRGTCIASVGSFSSAVGPMRLALWRDGRDMGIQFIFSNTSGTDMMTRATSGQITIGKDAILASFSQTTYAGSVVYTYVAPFGNFFEILASTDHLSLRPLTDAERRKYGQLSLFFASVPTIDIRYSNTSDAAQLVEE